MKGGGGGGGSGGIRYSRLSLDAPGVQISRSLICNGKYIAIDGCAVITHRLPGSLRHEPPIMLPSFPALPGLLHSVNLQSSRACHSLISAYSTCQREPLGGIAVCLHSWLLLTSTWALVRPDWTLSLALTDGNRPSSLLVFRDPALLRMYCGSSRRFLMLRSSCRQSGRKIQSVAKRTRAP